MSFSGSMTLRVIHTGICSCDAATTRIIYIRVSTLVILDASILQSTRVDEGRRELISLRDKNGRHEPKWVGAEKTAM